MSGLFTAQGQATQITEAMLNFRFCSYPPFLTRLRSFEEPAKTQPELKDSYHFSVKSTFGAFFSPSSASKNSAGLKLKLPAKITLGKTAILVLYSMTFEL